MTPLECRRVAAAALASGELVKASARPLGSKAHRFKVSNWGGIKALAGQYLDGKFGTESMIQVATRLRLNADSFSNSVGHVRRARART